MPITYLFTQQFFQVKNYEWINGTMKLQIQKLLFYKLSKQIKLKTLLYLNLSSIKNNIYLRNENQKQLCLKTNMK